MLDAMIKRVAGASALEELPAAVVLYDTNRDIVWANRAFREVSGLSLDEISGRPCRSVWKWGAPCTDCPVARAIETGLTVEAEGASPDSDPQVGPREFWLLKAAPLRDESGEIVGAVEIGVDVTAHKHAESALREQGQLLRLLIEHAPAAVAMFDRNMRYLAVSRRFSVDYELGDQPLVGRSHYDVFPEIEERWKEVHRRCLAGAVESAEEDPFPRADGRLDWVRWEIRPWYDAGDEIGGVILLSEVITERKRAEEKLRETESRYRQLLEVSPVGIAVHSEGRVVFVNPAGAHIIGADDPAQIVGMPITEIVHPDNLTQTADRIRRLLAGEQGLYPAEDVYMKLDGSPVPVEVMAAPLTYGGRPAVQVIVQDISERKRAQEALRESEARFRATFEQAAVGIAHVATEGRFLRINRRLCDIVGYARDELLALTFQEITHPDDLAADLAHVQRLIAGEIESYTLETRYLRKDGSIVWIDLTVALVRAEDGTPDYFISVIDDISGHKQAEAEREELRAQLAQAQRMESVGRLAGGVAHDFNNFLGVIQGYLGFALERIDPSDPAHEDLREAFKAAERSAEVTRQLLAFARRQTINPRTLDLNHTVEAMLKMLRRLIGEDIDLAWLPGRTLWPVTMDPSQVDQILANLSVNARDAIAGVGRVTIETRNVRLDTAYCGEHAGFVPGDYVMLAVSDDGRGMDEETVEHVFEPFFTTKAMGKGTGLGLSTVYGIVRQNDGFVNVYSEPRRGTTFRIYLPRSGEDAPAFARRDRSEVRRGEGETVLVVEDDEAILKLAVRMLESLGYSVLGSRTPSTAIAQAEEHTGRIHLLLTDVVMPEMNGRELAARLKAIRPDLHVVYMSGYTANVIAHRGVLEEGVSFVAKPFSLEDLADRVREALGGDRQ